MSPSPLTAEQENQVAERTSRARRRALEALGWIVQPRWDRHGPVTRFRFNTGAVKDGGPAIDHLSRWVHRATGRTVYVSEPYATEFTVDDVRAFAAQHGFQYAISDQLGLYYPDYAPAVLFWRGFTLDDLLGPLMDHVLLGTDD